MLTLIQKKIKLTFSWLATDDRACLKSDRLELLVRNDNFLLVSIIDAKTNLTVISLETPAVEVIIIVHYKIFFRIYFIFITS